ncbi:MAG: hypothetical protein C4537_06145 [Acholeplasma sp.]|nr:MAG: hypothetical protein C4537_06145 [Acholeplasma sp.]
MHIIHDKVLFVISDHKTDYLILEGNDSLGFFGELITVGSHQAIKIPLTHHNANILRSHFPFTNPIPVLRKKRSFGLGDRLGIAGEGHLRVFKACDAYPVLAQQSMRELTLTKRSYEDVLDAASFAVFKFGYHDGFGADGDHLKKMDDIENVLKLGYTMITLDCSDYIKNDVLTLSDEEIKNRITLPEVMKKIYLDREINVEGHLIHFNEMDLMRAYYVYQDAIEYTTKVYQKFFKNQAYAANLELSIDETMTPTKPVEHFFVANELKNQGVVLDTLAPRFCGEFQKGVDYIGDLNQFERELGVHAAIARHFDYKLSIHSGSDKFSIFSIIGNHTKGIFHIKTAGTNWLEAMRLVAIKDPNLYREIHAFALDAFDEARKLYHVTTDLTKIPSLKTLSDDELPALFQLNDARQLIHITYGAILTAENNQQDRFRTKLYRLWSSYHQEYARMLESHIGEHIRKLYDGFIS